MADRQGVSEHGRECRLSIGTQTHTRIVYEGRFCDRSVAPPARQLDGQRRRRPFALVNLANRLLFVNPFVVTFEIMKPRGAAGGNLECGCFVWNPSSLYSYREAKGDAVIENTDFHNILRLARRMSDRNPRAKATVYG